MDKVAYLWNGFAPLLRILIFGSIAIVGVLLVLGVSTKRVPLRMSPFDFALKVILGLTLGFVLTAEQVSLAEVLVVLVLLLSLQFTLSWLEKKSGKLAAPPEGSPVLLYYQGRFMEPEMKKQRVDQVEVLAAAGAKKPYDMDQVEAVVLEESRKLTVIKKQAKAATD